MEETSKEEGIRKREAKAEQILDSGGVRRSNGINKGVLVTVFSSIPIEFDQSFHNI